MLLAPDLLIEDRSDGICYRFPRRPADVRVTGLAPLGCGVVVAICLLLPSLFVGLVGPRALLPVALAMALPFVVLGSVLIAFGLFTLVGHTEIAVRSDRLVARECAGPLRWTRSRPLDRVQRLVIGEGDRAGRFLALRAECERMKPLLLVTGYPRPLLEAVADHLRRARGWEVRVTDPYTAADRRHNVRLTTAPESRGRIGFLVFLAVIWNTIVLGVGAGLLLESRSPVLWFVYPILGVFVAIGLAVAVMAGAPILARTRLRPVEVVVSAQPLRLGEAFEVRIRQEVRRPTPVDKVVVRLICREIATYRQGTATYTATKDVFVEEREFGHGITADTLQPIAGEIDFRIPPDAMHSFNALHNRIAWQLDLRTVVPGWPDDQNSLELRVVPERAGV